MSKNLIKAEKDFDANHARTSSIASKRSEHSMTKVVPAMSVGALGEPSVKGLSERAGAGDADEEKANEIIAANKRRLSKLQLGQRRSMTNSPASLKRKQSYSQVEDDEGENSDAIGHMMQRRKTLHDI